MLLASSLLRDDQISTHIHFKELVYLVAQIGSWNCFSIGLDHISETLSWCSAFTENGIQYVTLLRFSATQHNLRKVTAQRYISQLFQVKVAEVKKAEDKKLEKKRKKRNKKKEAAKRRREEAKKNKGKDNKKQDDDDNGESDSGEEDSEDSDKEEEKK